MGDGWSDWEGVYYTFTQGVQVKRINDPSDTDKSDYVTMNIMKTTNAQ